MDFMTWALQTAIAHPELKDALVTSDDASLDILLPDGRAFRFRPGALLNENAPEDHRTEILNKLISIGIAQAEHPTAEKDLEADLASQPPSAPIQNSEIRDLGLDPAHGTELPDFTTGDIDAPIVPIVRAADYYLRSHQEADSMVYLPLTDFIAAGIAYDLPQTIQPVYYSQIEDDAREVGEILAESVFTLRRMTGSVQHTVEIGMLDIMGARVLTFLQPANYELSWFCDLDMMQQVAEQVSAQFSDDIPLFVPASRTKLFVVFSEDPHLADFFKVLLAQRDSNEAVYPLPHTVAADGWREWVPFPGSELAEVLGTLRNQFRESIYAAQVKEMSTWGEFGALKDFSSRRLRNNERVSTTEWSDIDRYGSIPNTDYIIFKRAPSPHPWETDQGVNLPIRAHIAREVWPEGFERDENAWPPRWFVKGFPSAEQLDKLRESADREF
ncbi:hypothetical protein JOD55_000318 [Arcanobacterium pluranimalium]|uniref:hypothetical protein n=1 Tax=Arcanobacterium pluranimalium TaxID=108028 RepID=UPI00195B4BCA|nr:hypothetical protein [Arcanobacterium pluranimalium]MBM7824491.1 hypothetical protein [Arcanobacterium pluranimalium]